MTGGNADNVRQKSHIEFYLSFAKSHKICLFWNLFLWKFRKVSYFLSAASLALNRSTPKDSWMNQFRSIQFKIPASLELIRNIPNNNGGPYQKGHRIDIFVQRNIPLPPVMTKIMIIIIPAAGDKSIVVSSVLRLPPLGIYLWQSKG